MKSLRVVAISLVLSVVMFSVGCEQPQPAPVTQEPEVVTPAPFPKDTIPEDNYNSPPPVITAEPVPTEHPITTIEPGYSSAPTRRATKSQQAKPKENYAPAKKATGKTHVIKKGDTLQTISQKYYGTTKNWNKIANANKGVIKDPNKLKVGTKIKIP